MDCRLEAAASSRSDENPIPEGKVGQVCKEWLVREDGVVAYRLQNEEISQFYEGNRCKNSVVRTDLQHAKSLQQVEYKELRQMYEQQVKEQLEDDERIAKQVQEQLLNETQHHNRTEEKDQKLAKKLQAKERERLLRRRLEKEKQEVERIRSLKAFEDGAALPVSVFEYTDNQWPTAEKSLSGDDLQDIDLSEFCLQPPPGLTEEQLKAFQAEQDAELARFLQQHEAKRKYCSVKEKQMLIEAQDLEIARLLQEKERAKAKRLRDKARQQKAAQQRQEVPQASGDSQEGSGSYAPAPAPPGETYTTDQEVYADREEPPELAKRALPPLPKYHNIAIDLDPTYQKSETERQAVEPVVETDVNGLHFAQLCRVSPSSSESTSSPSSSLRSKEAIYELDEAQSYLPVQGQRRLSSERTKCKKRKDGCKTQ